MTPHAPAIDVAGLTKTYGNRTVVETLDLAIPAGVVAGLIGPNGAGKTTTMAMLLGLVRPTAGTGLVLGHPISRPTDYLRRVGALVEGPAFYPSLSGARNLEVFATAAGHRLDDVPELLELVGLASRADDRYRSYSLGMKQRLGVAAALLGSPSLLVLDEPANGLDPDGVREMRSLIGRLAADDRTVLVSSHDLSELEQICDWLVLLDAGRCLYQGTTRALLDGSTGGLVVVPHVSSDRDGLLRTLVSHDMHVREDNGALVVDVNGADPADVAASVNRLAFDKGIVLAELTPRRASLEDRYLTMVHGGTR